jgi:hypothetical protein
MATVNGVVDGAMSLPTGDPADEPDAPVTIGPRGREWLREWPVGVVLLAVTISLVIAVVSDVQEGVLMLAGSVLLAGLLRLGLPTRRAGVLAVRRRAADVITLFGVAAVLLVLGLITRGGTGG